MRKIERIISIRKQSSERIPRENSWFLNEEIVHGSSQVHATNFRKEGRYSGIKEDYDPFMTKTSEKNKFNKECLFVVDWQLTDA